MERLALSNHSLEQVLLLVDLVLVGFQQPSQLEIGGRWREHGFEQLLEGRNDAFTGIGELVDVRLLLLWSLLQCANFIATKEAIQHLSNRKVVFIVELGLLCG